jgi:NAD(P)H-flavin reductase
LKLIHEWGGVTIAYRRSIQESPAYINNHEELKKAFEEGIYYVEAVEPTAVELNKFGHSETLVCHKRIRDQEHQWATTKDEVRLPARSILVATGTQPNTAYEFEHRGTFNRLNLQYQHYEDKDNALTIAHGVEHCKDPEFGPFTSYQRQDKRVSLIGDTHPVFHGNVVKAIASGMRTYPKILAIFKDQLSNKGDEAEYALFAEKITYLFSAIVQSVTRKTQNVVELVIRAPLAARHYKPGQFYRLQNLETLAPHIDHTLIQMEPLTILPSDCDPENGTLTFVVHETSATAKLCCTLKANEPVSLMGPTGVRTKIPGEKETALIIGNQGSFAFLRSYGKPMRAAGNHLIFVAQLNNEDEIYCREELEQYADTIIWVTANGEPVKNIRAQDFACSGENALDALIASRTSLHDVDRVFLIGDTNLFRDFQSKRKDLVKHHLLKDPTVIASVYGNMQCMLKGVCAQCLQWQIDPDTGLRTKAVFACSWQDQPLEIIDIDHIDARKMQNTVHEKISSLWVDHLFKHYDVKRV